LIYPLGKLKASGCGRHGLWLFLPYDRDGGKLVAGYGGVNIIKVK